MNWSHSFSKVQDVPCWRCLSIWYAKECEMGVLKIFINDLFVHSSFRIWTMEVRLTIVTSTMTNNTNIGIWLEETLSFSHVTLPKELSKQIPSGQLLSEKEWRSLGIQMSLGWEHYATHKYIVTFATHMARPEPNILLFRRPLGTNGQTGKVDPELAERQRRQFRKQYGLE